MFPEPYSKELYVGREDLMLQMLKWIDEYAPSFRLRSVVGPVGSGKSWFIAHLYHKLKDKNPSIIVVWMNLSAKPVHPNTLNAIELELEPVLHGLAGWQNWLALAPGQILSSSADLGAKLADFLKQKGNKCEKIVVLVDGCDEVPQDERSWIEEHVLAVAFANAKVRLVMTRRDQDGLNHPILRWNNEVIKLPGMTTRERQEQIERRYQQDAAAGQKLSMSLPDVKAVLDRFSGENPYINTGIFNKFKKQQGTLVSDDLKECVRDISRRAGLSDDSFDLLEEVLYYLPGTWTVTDLSDKLGMRIDDLGRLFETGLIRHVSGKAQYEIDSGLYALYHSMRLASGFTDLGRGNGTP
ncbi:MAG: hypothetical protein Fur0021_31990 [Candidatus Promineifilaceae bacterium]